MQPLGIDLFCGLGGWTEGLLAEGYYVVGFDIERHQYGDAKYPAQLVLQDVTTLHGSQFRDAALIVASPPCQEFSYMAMPWSKAKAKERDLLEGRDDPKRLTALFDACFRIQREACEAAGRHIPMVVENVRGAQKWVGRARFNYGSFYLWGDVPALMPAGNHTTVGGINWSKFGEPGYKAKAFTSTAEQRFRLEHSGIKGIPPRTKGHLTNPAEHEGGTKVGGNWWHDPNSPSCTSSSGSHARKAASAMIAKIPKPLSRHIAMVFKPCAE